MSTAGPGSDPTLPETSWEVVSARGAMRDDLRAALKAPAAILRVPHNIDAKMHDRRHNARLPHYHQLTETLARWKCYRLQPNKPETWQVHARLTGQAGEILWLRIVLGPGRSGNWNLISLFLMEEHRVQVLIEASALIARI